MDYCDKPEESKKNPRAKSLFQRIANGDNDANDFLWRFWCFTHLYDDLVDNDKEVTNVEAASELAKFVTTLSLNPFYQKYKLILLPSIVNACDRWIAGDRLASSDVEREQAMGRVVRCGDLDMFAAVAFVLGGWDHLRALSAEIWRFDSSE